MTSAAARQVESETPNARPIPCMDDCCRMAGWCQWECEGRYYVPGGDDDAE